MATVRAVLLAGSGAVSAGSGVAYYFRPRPDVDDGVWCRTRDIHIQASDPKAEVSDFLRAPRPPVGDLDVEEAPWTTLGASRAAVTVVIGVAMRAWMHVFNDFECAQDEHLQGLVEAIENRPPNRPLLTVANHVSVADDPTLLCSMLPARFLAAPDMHRWGICTQEACFRNDLIGTIIGCGKILPIKRGAGVDQPGFLELCRHVAAGRWVHLFPEGKINQGGVLGLDWVGARPARASLACGGRLKWGVGKMIAHAPETPLVIPFVSVGMQQLLPCDPVSGELKPLEWSNLHGKRVVARVGPPIDFSDLVEAHTEAHGPLWKYGPRPAADQGPWREHWRRSSPAERQLYSAITARVEGALRRLETQAQQQHGSPSK